MDYSSRRPHWVPLLSAENRKRRLQFTHSPNRTIEDCKNVAWSEESRFAVDIQMIGPEFGVKNMKAWIHPALSQRFGWWWWFCNGGGYFLGHILGALVPIEHRLTHSLPEFVAEHAIPLDYIVPIF